MKQLKSKTMKQLKSKAKQSKAVGQSGKFKVYVAWGEDNSRELANNGNISLEKDNVNPYSFQTKREAEAFFLGINEMNGWMDAYALMGENCKIKGNTLYEK